MSAFQASLACAYRRGHHWAHPDCYELRKEDLSHLTDGDPRAVAMLQSYSRMFGIDYAKSCVKHHRRAPDFDGRSGPAMSRVTAIVLGDGVCEVPDLAPPADVALEFADPDVMNVACTWDVAEAQGDGNWKGCHGIGDFHSCIVDWDVRGIASHLKPVFKEVLTNVQKSDAALGLWNWFRDPATGKDLVTGDNIRYLGRANIKASFVSRSSGWIGLAQVINNSSCSWQEWCKYLSTYKPRNIVSEWSTLIRHELAHNKGHGHQPGNRNTLNPYIIAGLPLDRYDTRDRLYRTLVNDYGGRPVVGDDPPPRPPEDDIDTRLREQEIINVVQQEMLKLAVTTGQDHERRIAALERGANDE